MVGRGGGGVVVDKGRSRGIYVAGKRRNRDSSR